MRMNTTGGGGEFVGAGWGHLCLAASVRFSVAHEFPTHGGRVVDHAGRLALQARPVLMSEPVVELRRVLKLQNRLNDMLGSVPELLKRGRYRTDYDGPTLRENVYGAGQTKVLDTHPAAKYRGAYVGKPSTADTPSRDLSQG